MGRHPTRSDIPYAARQRRMTNDRQKKKLIAIIREKENWLPQVGTLAGQTLRLADHLIANGVTFATDPNVGGKWIPVTKNLPQPYVDVLVLRKNFDGKGYFYAIDHVCIVDIDNMERSEWFTDLLRWKSMVTHWMPLPEAPKEVCEE